LKIYSQDEKACVLASKNCGNIFKPPSCTVPVYRSWGRLMYRTGVQALGKPEWPGFRGSGERRGLPSQCEGQLPT